MAESRKIIMLKKNNKTKSKNRVIFQFLLSYAIILLIPLLIQVFATSKMVELIQNDTVHANLSILEQSKDIMDNHIDEINNMTMQLAWNNKLKKLMSSKISVKDSVWQIVDAQAELLPYFITNRFIEDLFIYITNKNIILSPHVTYSRLPINYNSLFKFDNMNYNEFHDKILNQYHSKDYLPSTKVILNQIEHRLITYMQSLPLEFSTHYKANLLIFINESEIHKLLDGLDIKDDGGWAYISDEYGNIITSYNKDIKEINYIDFGDLDKNGYDIIYDNNNQKMLMSYTKSLNNGWMYVAVSPYNVVMAKVNEIKKTTLLITLVFLLLGIVCAYFLAKKNIKPLNDIIAIINKLSLTKHKKYEGGNEYNYLHNTITEIVDNNKELKDAMLAQIPIMKAGFINRLLRGEFAQIDEIQNTLDQMSIDISAENYVVMILQIDYNRGIITKETLDEISIKKIIIRGILDNTLEEKVFYQDIDADKIAIIVCFDEIDPDECLERAKSELIQIVSVLASNDVKICISGGNICNNLLDISNSFYQAISTMEHAIATKQRKILWYNDCQHNNSRYYYPIDLELKLINYVRAGDNENVDKLLELVFNENLKTRELSADMIWQLLYEIRGTITKIMGRVKITDATIHEKIKVKIDALYHSFDISDIFDNITLIYQMIMDNINMQKRSHNISLKHDMMEYINNNYSNPDFSLCMMADHFELSEVYVSNFFKEQTGIKLSTYLEKKRIAHSQELLNQTKLSINEISLRVGYNSAHVFRRAFKRVNGVAPTSNRIKC